MLAGAGLAVASYQSQAEPILRRGWGFAVQREYTEKPMCAEC